MIHKACINCGLTGKGVIIYGFKREYPVCNMCLIKKYPNEKDYQKMRDDLQKEIGKKLIYIIGGKYGREVKGIQW